MNKAFLIGNLTRDPELTETTNGIKICRFTVAINRSYSSADGTKQADFLPIVCWRGLAENCARYLKKGSKVGIAGSIQTRSYDANDGTKRYVTEINADEVQFLSSRSDSYGDDYDNIQDLPEVEKKKSRIEELKPIDDDDLPF